MTKTLTAPLIYSILTISSYQYLTLLKHITFIILLILIFNKVVYFFSIIENLKFLLFIMCLIIKCQCKIIVLGLDRMLLNSFISCRSYRHQ